MQEVIGSPAGGPAVLDALPQASNLSLGAMGWSDDRLRCVQERYSGLDGELPRKLGSFVVSVIDGIEPPDGVILPELYAEQLPEGHPDRDSFAMLLYVNYQ